jgi:hypothetical protein
MQESSPKKRFGFDILGTSLAARDVNSRRSFWAPSWEEGKAALGWMTEHEWADKMEAAKEEQILYHHFWSVLGTELLC